MILCELVKRLRFWKSADRIGPDIPITHWRLYYPLAMKNLCKKKFGSFGEGAQFRPGAYAITCSKIFLGENVIIRPGCMLFADPREKDKGRITIMDHVMLGSGVQIYVANHRFDDPSIPFIKQGHYPPENVILKSGCWIGANSIILPGVTVGENTVIGAGSIVTKSIPPNVVAAGNPAKIIREIH